MSVFSEIKPVSVKGASENRVIAHQLGREITLDEINKVSGGGQTCTPDQTTTTVTYCDGTTAKYCDVQ